MAGRKKSTKKAGRSSSKKPLGLLFWALFFVVTSGLFLVNRNRIRETLENTRVLDHLPVSLPRIGGREKAEEAEQRPEEPARPAPAVPQIEPRTAPPQTTQPVATQPASAPPAAAQPPAPRTEPQPPAPPAPAGQNPPPKPSVASRTAPPANPPAAATQERAVYFARIDAEGTILRTRVVRRLPASDSPMMDSLRSLIAGPNAEEERQGLRSLIPPGTRLLPATMVRGNTAYVSFSEDFQYNTFGVEGYAAQLRQVIWTVTEFPNVRDVQILIEGRRIDYLGEGIWIGSPLNRDSL